VTLRLPLAGSAVLMTAALALPTFATPDDRPGITIHRDTRSELASVATTAPAIGGRPRWGAPLQTNDGTWLNKPGRHR
jgi:hypothetical protein